MTVTTAFACDMTAIPADRRAAHHALSRRLFHEEAIETRNVPDGISFVFLAASYDDIAEFVAGERLCCPFLRFCVDVAPDRGAIILTLTGPSGAADFIRAELSL